MPEKNVEHNRGGGERGEREEEGERKGKSEGERERTRPIRPTMRPHVDGMIV